MGSINLWNEMLESFLDDLTKTFPEQQTLATYRKSLPLLIATNPRMIFDKFMSDVTPYSEYIQNKNEELFKECKIEFLTEINIENMWDESSQNNKDAIWNYLSTLLMLGQTLAMIPAETMTLIEKMAGEMAQNMPADGLPLNPAMLTNMLGGMMNNNKM